MTPREALSVFALLIRDMALRSAARPDLDTAAAKMVANNAFVVLERLVSKDEADRKFISQRRAEEERNRKPPPRCTCGTVTPCSVLGHS